jgi:hypothetical protein
LTQIAPSIRTWRCRASGEFNTTGAIYHLMSRVIGVRRFVAMIWIADAHHDDGKRFVVRAEQKLSAALRD